MRLTGASVNQVNYLREMRRLPIARESKGQGYPTLYKLEAVEAVKKHLNRFWFSD